jgi:hypothetical protein
MAKTALNFAKLNCKAMIHLPSHSEAATATEHISARRAKRLNDFIFKVFTIGCA